LTTLKPKTENHKLKYELKYITDELKEIKNSSRIKMKQLT